VVEAYADVATTQWADSEQRILELVCSYLSICPRPDIVSSLHHDKTSPFCRVSWSTCSSVEWWHPSVRLQFTAVILTSYRCICRPVLTTSPTGCHQIICSSTPIRLRSCECDARQLADKVSCLLHYYSEQVVYHVMPSTVVQNLGIYLDSDVSMCSRVSRTVSQCFGIPRQLLHWLITLSLSAPPSLLTSALFSVVIFLHVLCAPPTTICCRFLGFAQPSP